MPPDEAARRRSQRIGIALALAGAACFSAKAIFVKLLYAQGVDVTTTFAMRMVVALPFFVLLALWHGSAGLASLERRDLLGIVACGLLGFYLSSWLDFVGLSYIPASLERLILFLYPTFVVVLSRLLHGTSLTRSGMAALALSYAGVVLVVWQSLDLAGSAGALAIGTAFTLASAFTYACYVIASTRIIGRIGSLRFTAYASTVACVASIAHFGITHDIAQMLAVPAPAVGLALGLGTVATVLPILLVAEALRRLGATQVALLSSVGPVVTITLAWLLLGESISLLQSLGAGLVIAGVVLVSLRPAAVPARHA